MCVLKGAFCFERGSAEAIVRRSVEEASPRRDREERREEEGRKAELSCEVEGGSG